MTSVLERATGHFREKLGGDLKSIDVPEWDCKVYFKTSITLKEQSKLIELATSGKTVEALVETLIVKARNQDGSKMFGPMDKQVFLNEVDPDVIIRVVADINRHSDPDNQEELEKN